MFIDDFYYTRDFSYVFCLLLFLVVSLYAVDVDAVDACLDGAGSAVVHADVGVLGPSTIATSAKSC